MKKIFIAVLLYVSISSCNSGGDSEATGDTTGRNLPGMQNVNGNIPDTTNAISIDDDVQDTSGSSTDTTQK